MLTNQHYMDAISIAERPSPPASLERHHDSNEDGGGGREGPLGDGREDGGSQGEGEGRRKSGEDGVRPGRAEISIAERPVAPSCTIPATEDWTEWHHDNKLSDQHCTGTIPIAERLSPPASLERHHDSNQISIAERPVANPAPE